jgi:hypothetical protein
MGPILCELGTTMACGHGRTQIFDDFLARQVYLTLFPACKTSHNETLGGSRILIQEDFYA